MNSPATYTSKPRVVEAIQFTGDNVNAVKSFGGSRITDGQGGLLWAELQHGGMALAPGYWLVKIGHGFTVLNDSSFRNFYALAIPRT